MKTTNEPKTMKYIVEGPIPQDGQKASSGGIRKNGKLQAQYKDPVPYTGPIQRIDVRSDDHIKKMHTYQSEQIKAEIKSFLWREIGKPLLRKGLHMLIETVMGTIDTKEYNQIACQTEAAVKETEVDESSFIADNVIQFPGVRVS